MEKMDCTVKDVLIKRDLSKMEISLIGNLVDTLHHDIKMIHRDMKPSNIGTQLDTEGKITELKFLDCQKVRSLNGYSQRKIKRSISRDWKTFYKHMKKNVKYDRKRK